MAGQPARGTGHWPDFAQLAHVAPQRVREAAFQQRCWQAMTSICPPADPALLAGDAGRLITFGLVVTRGRASSARMWHLPAAADRPQPRHHSLAAAPRRRAGLRATGSAAHPGQPFPLLVAIGADPATTLAAVAPVPDTLSEYEFAGLLRGERTRVWHSTATGLDAPAGCRDPAGGLHRARDTRWKARSATTPAITTRRTTSR